LQDSEIVKELRKAGAEIIESEMEATNTCEEVNKLISIFY
jgi:hypothetical protein